MALNFDNASSAMFYPEFKSSGHSPLLIGVNSVKALVAGVGILLNLSLLLVTVVSRSLHGSCNILLALDSLFSALYLLSPFVSLWLSATGQNFLPLAQCFPLQAVPIFGVSCSFGLMLFIALERLVSIQWPVWFNGRNPRCYLPAIGAFCMGVAVYNLYTLSTVQSNEIMVLCTLPDTYRGTPGQDLYRNGLLSICATLGCYIFIGFQMHRSLTKRNAKMNQATRRMFKSLVVLICLAFFGWLVDILVRLALPLLKLQPLALSVFSNLLSNCSFIAAGGNAAVLYAFSKDYRAAYNTQLNRLFRQLGLPKGWHMNSNIDIGPTQLLQPPTQPAMPVPSNGLKIRSASIAVVGGLSLSPPPVEDPIMVMAQQKKIRSVSLKT